MIRKLMYRVVKIEIENRKFCQITNCANQSKPIKIEIEFPKSHVVCLNLNRSFAREKMGCKSSKKPPPESEVTQELPPEPDRLEQRRKHFELIEERRKAARIKKELHIKELFYDVVARALEDNLELITMRDLESHLCKNHRSVIDGFNQHRVIQKVIGDEFLKGHLFIRSTKGNCQ